MQGVRYLKYKMNLCEMCECRREDAYWSNSEQGEAHFFAKVLPQGFHQSLAIPMNYVRNLVVKPPIRVSLKVADDRIWNVGVKEREGNMVLERGWREFVEDNSLKENDVVVFRCHDFGQVCFHVQLFDQTGYEKDKLHQYVQDSKKRARQDNHMEAKKPKSEALEVQTELHQKTVNPSPQEGREFKRAGPSRAATDEPDFVDVKPLINLQKKSVVTDGFQVERQSNPVETAHEIPSLRTPTRHANGEGHPETSQQRRSPQEGREFNRAGPSRAATDESDFVDVKRLINLQKKSVVNDGFQVERQSNPVENAHEIPSLRTPTRNANGEDHSETSQQRRSTHVRRVYTKKTLVSQGRSVKDVKNKVPTDQRALPGKRFVRNVDGEDGQKTSQQRRSTHVRRVYMKKTLVSQGHLVKDIKNEVPTDQRALPSKRFVRNVDGEDVQKTSQLRKSTRNSSRKSKKRVREREEKIEAEPVLSQSKAEHDSTIRSPIGHDKTYRLYLISLRRAVTDEERHRAFQSANAIISYKPNFISVMKPSHVLQRFFLTIPQRLMKEHIPRKAKEAILRVLPDSKTWIISLSVRSFSAGLNIGWADFVFDNNLEEGDVCSFEMCGVQECGRFLIDVSIHRVVQEVVPLIRVLPSPSMKGKKGGMN